MKNEVITDDIFRLQCELRKKSLLPSSKERFIVCSEKENFLDYFCFVFFITLLLVFKSLFKI